MKGIFLRFYMRENHKQGHTVLFEWLLARAKETGIHGGSVFRGIAGFGHDGVLHEQSFTELAGECPLLVEFMTNEENATRMLKLVNEAGVKVLYATAAAEFGTTG